ncbi:MAG: hypothetical protein R2867_17690 [Caldilineaceae bacterium]
MSWNGATRVARYVLYGGVDRANWAVTAAVPRSGFETTYSLDPAVENGRCFWQVEALAGDGTPLQRSVIQLRDTPHCLQLYGMQIYLPIVRG